MCYFVAIGVEPSLLERAQAHLGYTLVPASAYVERAFDRSQKCFILNTGHCACDLFKNPLNEAELEKIRGRLEKRGWSLTRIQRSLEQRRKHGGLEIEFVRRIANAALRVGRLSVLVYWESGEAISLEGAIQAHSQELLENPWLIRANRRVDVEV